MVKIKRPPLSSSPEPRTDPAKRPDGAVPHQKSAVATPARDTLQPSVHRSPTPPDTSPHPSLPNHTTSTRVENHHLRPPNATLLHDHWQSFLDTEDPSSEFLKEIQPLYENLTNTHVTLTEQYDAISLNALPLKGDSQGPLSAGSLYQEAHQNFQARVQRFIRELSSSTRPRDKTRTHLQQQIQTKLERLTADLPSQPRPEFIEQYSWFASEFGLGSADKHQLTSQVNQLAERSQSLKDERLLIEHQRVHFLAHQQSATEIEDLEKLLIQIDDMAASVDRYRHNLREFIAHTHNFKEHYTQVTQAEKRGQPLSLRDNLRLKKILRDMIGSLQTIRPPSEEFKKNYYRIRMEVGPHQAEATYLSGRFETLHDQYLTQKKNWDHLQLFAALLDGGAYTPNELNSYKRMKDVIRWVESMAKRHHSAQQSFTSSVRDFHQECQKVKGLGRQTTFQQKVATLHTAFMQIPKQAGTEDILSQPFSQLLQTHPDHPDRTQWEAAFNILNQDLQGLITSQDDIQALRASITSGMSNLNSNKHLKKLEQNVLLCIRLTNDHNARTETYLSKVEAFTRSLPLDAKLALPSSHKPETTPESEALTTYLSSEPDRILKAIGVRGLSDQENTSFYFTPNDRLKTIRSFLPPLSTNAINKSGAGVIHKVISNRDLSENEKVILLQGLKRLKADFNQPNAEGIRPLDLALRYSKPENLVIKALHDLGASPSEESRIRIAAHLLGTGGSMPHPSPLLGVPQEVPLEGLTSNLAHYGLDPVVRKILQQHIPQASQKMEAPLQHTLNSWANIRDASSLIQNLEAARSPSTQHHVSPSVLMTGWTSPNAHALGFVFNQEGDESYLYACNTGGNMDPSRTIVKYKVVDFEKTIQLFRSASRNPDETRGIYVGPPSLWGLERCPEEEQIPSAIDKSSQKRGNCPMAARKACALAMLWSTSRDTNVPPSEVKATYKAFTTDLRKEGVQQAIESENPILQGKALVSLLTKLDRPGYDTIAYNLANTIMRQQNPRFWWLRKGAQGKVPATGSPQYLATIRSALATGKQDLGAITSTFGEDLAIHALRKGNSKAATILQALIDDEI